MEIYTLPLCYPVIGCLADKTRNGGEAKAVNSGQNAARECIALATSLENALDHDAIKRNRIMISSPCL